MKKLAIILFSITIMLTSLSTVALANGNSQAYFKVTYSNAVLYVDSGCTQIYFGITENCYVEMLSNDVGTCRVSYMGIEGYMDRSHLSASPAEDWVTEYYHQSKTVTTSRKSFLYTSTELEDSITDISKNAILTVIGIYPLDTTLLYCRDSVGNVGYVESGDTSWSSSDTLLPPVNTNNSTPTPDDNSGSTPPSSSDISNNADPLRIILILGICIPAGIIVYLLFKPVTKVDNRYISDTPKKRGYFEVEDYDYEE